MKIEAVRHIVGMSQREFSNYFGIPVGTLRNWEQGISSPPTYVFNMIFQSIRRDKMINLETIKFNALLNKLAELSENGIENFKDATEETWDEKLFYDETTEDANGDYLLVRDACVSEEDHDAISYYESESGEYTIKVKIDDKPYITVKLTESEEEITIENGRWYF